MREDGEKEVVEELNVGKRVGVNEETKNGKGLSPDNCNGALRRK